MTLQGGADEGGRFGIGSLADPDSQPRRGAPGSSPWTLTGRPVRRDLHWWLGGALLAIAFPMLLWQSLDQQGSTRTTPPSEQGRRDGLQVRPPETIGALERTIEDQARMAMFPAMPPLSSGITGRDGPLPPLPPRPGNSEPDERRRHELPAVSLPPADGMPTRVERLAAEQERRDAEARSSPLLAIGQGGSASPPVTLRADRSAPDLVHAPGANGAEGGFAPAIAATPASAGDPTPSPAWRAAPGGPAVLEGTVIPAVLLTEINSELPGTLVAQVTQDIWDSVEARHLMIPKGSRLIGDYNSDVRAGQERVLAAFRRLIFPNGSSIDLLGTQATDAQGRSGLHDRVERHFWTIFGASFIVAGLASLVQRQEAQPSTVIVVPGASSALASAAGSVLVETSRAILGRTRNIPPTLVIRQGHRFSLTVQRHFLLVPSDAGTMPYVSR